jgi:hypothetical protein
MSSFFGNPWMLAALVVASLPWIIEWLFRRRKRQVDLPTIRYLLKNKDQEKIKRQDRILLILRTVALALLVLALTRPRVQQGGGKTVRKRHVVMVLDGTASMNQQVGVLTAFDLAQKKAAAIVQGIEGAASVTVLELGAQVETVLDGEDDLHTAAAQIDALRATLGAGSMRDALVNVKERLDRANRRDAEIYIFSDFQQFTWAREGAQTAECGNTLRALGAQNEIYLVDVGADQGFNYVVTDLRPAEWVLSTGLPATFQVRIETWGKAPADARPTVTFLVDGVKKDVREFTPGDRPVTVTFPYRFAQAGEHLAEINVEGDQHAIDNRRYYLCTVPDAFNVLILDDTAPLPAAPSAAGERPAAAEGDASAPLTQESAFLARAIAPPSHPGMEKVTRFKAKSVPLSMLRYENVDSYKAVLLARAAALDEASAVRLEQYVLGGGALWVFLGPDLNIYEYNKLLFKDGKGVLPAKLVSKETPAKPESGVVQFGQSTHPALHGLAASADADARVLGYYKLENIEGARVVLSTADKTPVLLEKDAGRGRVLLANTGAGVNATYLPAVMEYPVFVQDMLRYVVGNPDQSVNLDTGDVFEQPVFVSAQHVLLRTPNGRRVRLTPRARDGQADAYFLRYDQTDQQGIYDLLDVVPGAVPRTRFVVNQKSMEGDLTRLGAKELQTALGSAKFTWVGPDVPVEDLAVKMHAVMEFSRPVLWLLVAALGVESFLALRFGRRRAKAGPA